MADDSELERLRAAIDAIDTDLLEKINRRAELARRVRTAKGESESVALYRPEREARVIRRLLAENPGPLGGETIRRLFREIMSACLAQQEALKIGYLGPPGTFSQAAVHEHFGHAIRALPLTTIDELFGEVEAGNADFGVVPVENSTEGMIDHTLDNLLLTPLLICGEIEMSIRQHLLSKSRYLEGIERIYSHRSSLAQCRMWLRKHLPNAERIPVASNAEAARRVRHAPDAAAIAGEEAASIYGLDILKANIQDRSDNSTRFLVIGRERFPPSGRDKTTLLLATADRPGALYALLDPLAKADITLTRIESRPSREGKWDYVFFLDVVGHAEVEPLRSTLAKLPSVRVLGSYPSAH